MQRYSPERRREAYNWNNSVASLSNRIAGGFRAYKALPRDERLLVRAKAKVLVALGADFATAQRAEATESSGFVYVIDHPRLPGVKVGRAFDPESRLRGYQTGCPERAYRLRYADYFEDCHVAENAIHARLNPHRLEGEWFDLQPDEALETIEAYARLIARQLEETANVDS